MTVQQAREAALEVFLRVRRGEDPAADRRAAKHAPTVADLADRHIEEHAKVKNKPRGAKRARQLWNRSILGPRTRTPRGPFRAGVEAG